MLIISLSSSSSIFAVAAMLSKYENSDNESHFWGVYDKKEFQIKYEYSSLQCSNIIGNI